MEEGIKVTSSRWNASLISSAPRKWPKWMGLKVPPNKPTLLLFPFSLVSSDDIVKFFYPPMKFQIPISKSQIISKIQFQMTETHPLPRPPPSRGRVGVGGNWVTGIYLQFGAWNLVLLYSYLSFSINNKFRRGQLFQPHGTKGVDFGGADSDLSTQA